MSKPLTGSILNCFYCNKECYVKKHRISKFKYCSRKCGGLYIRKQESKTCLICKELFISIVSRCNSAKYCSNKCRYIAHKGSGHTEYTCQHCHKKFNAPLSTKRKYCSKACVQKPPINDYNPKYSTIRKAMLSRGLIKQCENCSYDKHPQILGVHHKDRDRNNNSLENLAVLCPNCHSIEHMKHISHGFKE